MAWRRAAALWLPLLPRGRRAASRADRRSSGVSAARLRRADRTNRLVSERSDMANSSGPRARWSRRRGERQPTGDHPETRSAANASRWLAEPQHRGPDRPARVAGAGRPLRGGERRRVVAWFPASAPTTMPWWSPEPEQRPTWRAGRRGEPTGMPFQISGIHLRTRRVGRVVDPYRPKRRVACS